MNGGGSWGMGNQLLCPNLSGLVLAPRTAKLADSKKALRAASVPVIAKKLEGWVGNW